MSIIAKYLYKNIFLKPVRTIILIICIMCCGFVASLSLDMGSNIQTIVYGMMTQIMGAADVIISLPVGTEEAIPSEVETKQLLVQQKEDAFIQRYDDDGMYIAFKKNAVTVKTCDYNLANELALIDKSYDLSENEAVISMVLAKKEGLEIGDQIRLMSDRKTEEMFKVVAIAAPIGMANGRSDIYVSAAGFDRLRDSDVATFIYADLGNTNQIVEEKAEQFKADVLKADYNADVQILIDSADMKEEMKSFKLIFTLLFLLCLLLVIFVAISVSGRIVCERMSVVGTFRSLGLSSAFTTKILLLENALYGALGGALGALIYAGVRRSIYTSVLSVSASTELTVTVTVPEMSVLSMMVVVLFAVGLMCACPLKEIIKTSRMPIRDIIFDNKDTEYKLNKINLYVGICGIVIAAICMVLKGQVVLQIVAFALSIVSVAMVFPFVLKFMSNIFAKIFDKANMPVAYMAANSVATKKSTVGSSVLAFTVSVLAIMIFIFVATAGSLYDLEAYDCDVIVTAGYEVEAIKFGYIDTLKEAKEVEQIFGFSSEAVRINGSKLDANVFGLNPGGYRLFNGIENAPESISDEEFYIDKNLADRNGIKVGDMVEIEFASENFFPITKTLKLAGYIDSFRYDTVGTSILISKNLYCGIYNDAVDTILIKCDNPEEMKQLIESHSSGYIEEVKTLEEYRAYWEEKKVGARALLIGIIIIGVGLTLTGIISNQLIGFEGRKRECAVLLSTAMTREKLSKLFVLESFIASGVSLLLALPVSLVAFVPFTNVLRVLAGGFRVEYHVGQYLIFIVILWIIFTGVALFPVKELRKMNIAAQLKYE